MILTTKEIETLNKILEVLRREVEAFEVALDWTISEEVIEVICSNGYSASLFAENDKYIMKNQFGVFKESDIIDGLCRVRFEIIRYLNPIAFV